MVKNLQKSKFSSTHPSTDTAPQPTITTPKKQDVFTGYNQGIEKYFSAAKKTTAIYLQSVTDLQEKIIESWKKSMDLAITLQQKFAKESKMNVEVPDVTIKIIKDMAEQANNAQELQNKMLLVSIEAIRQNIKSFNNNVRGFTEVNRKLVHFYGSQMTAPNIGPETFKAAISEFKKVVRDIEVERKLK